MTESISRTAISGRIPTTDPVSPPPNCTFDTEAWQILSRQWFPVALADQISGAPTACVLLDQPLVVYRIDQHIVIAPDICPHRGVPLSLGSFDGVGLVCAYHGLRFGADGRCNHIPSSPDAPIAERLHLKTYPAVEQYGLVWTCLQPESDMPDIPEMPFWNHAGFQQIVCPTVDIAGFAGRQVEGFLDVAHFGWVHMDTFGDSNNTRVPTYTTSPRPKGFSADYRSFVGNYPIGSDQWGRQDFEWLRHFEVHLPFTATLTIDFPEDGKLVIMNAASPISARKTRLFAPIARNFDKDLPIEKVHEFNLRVFEEDRLIVESQRPADLPLDPRAEAHIPADRSSIAYRKALREMGFSRFLA